MRFRQMFRPPPAHRGLSKRQSASSPNCTATRERGSKDPDEDGDDIDDADAAAAADDDEGRRWEEEEEEEEVEGGRGGR